MESENNSSFSFWKNILVVSIFLIFTPLALSASVVSLVAITSSPENNQNPDKNLLEEPKAGINVYASLAEEVPAIDGEIISADARPIIIENFLQEYDSPLTNYADFIVETSDKYDLDWRLITAIAMKESGLCKAIPENSYNCWGWGIHSKGTLTFDSFEEGIETVSKGLKENYIDKGYVTVNEIMTKYAHPDSTTWANDVLMYMDELR